MHRNLLPRKRAVAKVLRLLFIFIFSIKFMLHLSANIFLHFDSLMQYSDDRSAATGSKNFPVKGPNKAAVLVKQGQLELQVCRGFCI